MRNDDLLLQPLERLQEKTSVKNKIMLFALLSAPVYAHEIPFDDKALLSLTNGNIEGAAALDDFCAMNGIADASCADSFKNAGPFAMEAAQSCVAKAQANISAWAITVDMKALAKRGHLRQGVVHTDYRTSNGETHRHEYSDFDRREAKEQYKAILIDRAVRAYQAKDGEYSSSIANGIESTIEGIGASVGGSKVTEDSHTKGPLSPLDMLKIDKRAEDAAHDPSIVKKDPSILCFWDEVKCIKGNGEPGPDNKDYKAPLTEAQKKDSTAENDKKEDTQTASSDKQDPKDTVDTAPVVHDDPTIFADNDRGLEDDGTMIATPVIDDDYQITGMDACIKRETKRIIKHVGGKHDVTEGNPVQEKNEKAEDMLKRGYCDEQVYGRDFCMKFKFQRDSVPVIDLESNKQDEYNRAMSELNEGLGCDISVLGADMCRKWRNKMTEDKHADSGLDWFKELDEGALLGPTAPIGVNPFNPNGPEIPQSNSPNPSPTRPINW